jgi:hypothetical protein
MRFDLFQTNTWISRFQYSNYEILKKERNKVMVNGVNLYLNCKEFLCVGWNSENQLFLFH